jgi:hypothetical protein
MEAAKESPPPAGRASGRQRKPSEKQKENDASASKKPKVSFSKPSSRDPSPTAPAAGNNATSRPVSGGTSPVAEETAGRAPTPEVEPLSTEDVGDVGEVEIPETFILMLNTQVYSAESVAAAAFMSGDVTQQAGGNGKEPKGKEPADQVDDTGPKAIDTGPAQSDQDSSPESDSEDEKDDENEKKTLCYGPMGTLYPLLTAVAKNAKELALKLLVTPKSLDMVTTNALSWTDDTTELKGVFTYLPIDQTTEPAIKLLVQSLAIKQMIDNGMEKDQARSEARRTWVQQRENMTNLMKVLLKNRLKPTSDPVDQPLSSMCIALRCNLRMTKTGPKMVQANCLMLTEDDKKVRNVAIPPPFVLSVDLNDLLFTQIDPTKLAYDIVSRKDMCQLANDANKANTAAAKETGGSAGSGGKARADSEEGEEDSDEEYTAEEKRLLLQSIQHILIKVTKDVYGSLHSSVRMVLEYKVEKWTRKPMSLRTKDWISSKYEAIKRSPLLDDDMKVILDDIKNEYVNLQARDHACLEEKKRQQQAYSAGNPVLLADRVRTQYKPPNIGGNGRGRGGSRGNAVPSTSRHRPYEKRRYGCRQCRKKLNEALSSNNSDLAQQIQKDQEGHSKFGPKCPIWGAKSVYPAAASSLRTVTPQQRARAVAATNMINSLAQPAGAAAKTVAPSRNGVLVLTAAASKKAPNGAAVVNETQIEMELRHQKQLYEAQQSVLQAREEELATKTKMLEWFMMMQNHANTAARGNSPVNGTDLPPDPPTSVQRQPGTGGHFGT